MFNIRINDIHYSVGSNESRTDLTQLIDATIPKGSLVVFGSGKYIYAAISGTNRALLANKDIHAGEQIQKMLLRLLLISSEAQAYRFNTNLMEGALDAEPLLMRGLG